MTSLPYTAAHSPRALPRCGRLNPLGNRHFRCLGIALVLVFLLDLSPLHGQHFKPTFRQFTMEDGIPQSQIRSITRGPEGLFWISTQSGLTVFDGQQFHTPLLDDFRGLYLVNAIKTKKRLYLNTLNEVLIYSDSLYLPKSQSDFPGHKQLRGCLAEDLCFVINIPPEGEAELLYLRGDSLHEVAELLPELSKYTIYYSHMYPEISKAYFTTKEAHILEYDAQQNRLSHIDSTLLKDFDAINGNWQRPFVTGIIADERQEVFYLSPERGFSIARRAKGESTFTSTGKNPPEILYSKSDFAGEGVYKLQDSIYQVFDDLPAQVIRHILWEETAAYAISDRGVFVIYHNGLERSEADRWIYPWAVTPWSDSTFCIGTYQNGLFISDGEGNTLQQIEYPPMKAYKESGRTVEKIPEILSNKLVTDRWQLWGSIKGFLAYDRVAETLDYHPNPFAVEAFGFDHSSGDILTASQDLCRRSPEDLSIKSCEPIPEEVVLNINATDLLVAKSGQYWVAGRGGVAQLGKTDSSMIYTKDRGNFPFRAAISLAEDPQKGVWAGGSNGLARFQDNEWRSVRRDWIQGNINQLLILDSGLSVAVSPFSIYVFQILEDGIQPIYTYSQHNGYGPTEPSENGLFYEEKRHCVWIPTMDGIYRLHLDEVPKSGLDARLSVIGINGELESMRKKDDPLAGSFAEVSLSMLDPSHQRWEFRYQLNEEEMSPLIDDATFLISNLQHGKNKIRLQAVRPERPEQFVETELTLFTRLPLTRRPAFIWGLVASILTLLVLLFSVAVRDYRRNKRLQQLELELQFNRLKTLEAYFNPHFIFNTLTAIQDNILQRNKERGNELIIKLSRIFRYALKVDPAFIEYGTRQKKPAGVPLSEELQLIRDYVFLQQAQHPDIEYVEEIDPDALAQDIHIPKLLIQPFVENIFKHAFPHRENEDKITLRVQLEEGRLFITLLDNGRGQQPNEIQTERQSLGKKLALERMKILQNMGIKNEISITHDAHGTRVKINIDYESYRHRR